MEHLYAVVDYGSSALKVVYSRELNDTPKYFTMQPEIIEVSADAVKGYRKNFSLDPARHAFVGTNDRYYAVGELAQEVFRSTLNLTEPKSNNAIGRTLAAITVAAQLRNNPTAREQELDNLLKAIDISKGKFWNSFVQWLAIQLPLDEVVFGGGVAELFKTEMLDYLSGKLPNLPNKNCPAIYLHGGLEYPDNTLIPAELQARFADVQCLWEKDILPVAKSYWNDIKK